MAKHESTGLFALALSQARTQLHVHQPSGTPLVGFGAGSAIDLFTECRHAYGVQRAEDPLCAAARFLRHGFDRCDSGQKKHQEPILCALLFLPHELCRFRGFLSLEKGTAIRCLGTVQTGLMPNGDRSNQI